MLEPIQIRSALGSVKMFLISISFQNRGIKVFYFYEAIPDIFIAKLMVFQIPPRSNTALYRTGDHYKVRKRNIICSK